MKKFLSLLLILLPVMVSARERVRFDDGWEFAYGNAASPALDFGAGTEYFNYLTKAASVHNEGPYVSKFDKTKWPAPWKAVTLPHDWVVDLPFAREASHSHGYKTVGFNNFKIEIGIVITVIIPDCLSRSKTFLKRFTEIDIMEERRRG